VYFALAVRLQARCASPRLVVRTGASTSTFRRKEFLVSNPVGWFEIYVDDMRRAKKFYEEVLGTKFTRLESPEIEMWQFPGDMKGNGTSGALVHMDGFPAGRNSVIVYFMCDDCAVEGARVEKAGGKMQRGKTSIGQYGFIVLAYDSEGNMIGLHSMK